MISEFERKLNVHDVEKMSLEQSKRLFETQMKAFDDKYNGIHRFQFSFITYFECLMLDYILSIQT